MNSSREDFLGLVRQAVGAGNRPGVGGSLESRGRAGYQGADAQPLQHFREEFAAVGGVFHLVADDETCRQEILQLVLANSAKRILLGGGELIHRLSLESQLIDSGADVISVDGLTSDSCKESFFAADFGISAVDYLVAETGTVVLYSSPHQPRSLSLLPPVHIAVAERRQLVPDLFDLFPSSQNEQVPTLPSCITFITGPSKTGDIELRLVTGVHGPGEIHVILIDE